MAYSSFYFPPFSFSLYGIFLPLLIPIVLLFFFSFSFSIPERSALGMDLNVSWRGMETNDRLTTKATRRTCDDDRADEIDVREQMAWGFSDSKWTFGWLERVLLLLKGHFAIQVVAHN